jgi:hypothetical protein
MDVETKPRRRWKQRKADYLAAIAAMQAERDAAQMDAFEARMSVAAMEDERDDMKARLFTWRVIAFTGSASACVAGLVLGLAL